MSFTPGTLIATQRGQVQVQDLRPGDKVKTRDNGLQKIVWVGQSQMSGRALLDAPHLRPVLIREDAFGVGLPCRDMMVTPNSRIPVGKERTSLMFFTKQAIVAAKNLVDHSSIQQIDCIGTTYIHLQFKGHQGIRANDLWVENFDIADYSLGAIGNSQRNEIREVFPSYFRAQTYSAPGSARNARAKRAANHR
jgi:hypothetical protein